MLVMDTSIARINDNDELNRILESTVFRKYLDKVELTDLPPEQLDSLSQEKLDIKSAPAMDTSDNSG